jgi:DNA-binding XRE family transcriptional regulator
MDGLRFKASVKRGCPNYSVDEVSIYNWEKNRTSPHVQHIPKIIEFLGSVPTNVQSNTFGERIVYDRQLKGMSQENIARFIGVDPCTLRNWENGKRQPLKRYLKTLNTFVSTFNSQN